MKTITLTLLIIALVGCAEPTQNTTADPIVPEVAPSAPSVLAFNTTRTEIITQAAQVTVSGSVSHDTLVSMTYDGDIVHDVNLENGTWMVTFPVRFGHSYAEFFADNGATTQNINVTIQRRMMLTVEITHDPASGKEDRVDEIYWDYGGMRSARDDDSYEGCSQEHPGRPNAHDALLDYSDITGIPITYTDCGTYGVSVDDVDSVDYGQLGWCFTVNGEAADFGISLLELEDGDIFAFQNCAGLF